MTDVSKIRSQFPIYKNHPNLSYLDSGATSLKPQVVLDRMNEYYSEYGVNIHRGVYHMSYKATDEFERARTKVATFLNSSSKEIIFTRNTTDGLNKACLMYSKHLQAGDEVITTELEHHSSVLPWLNKAKEMKLKLSYIPLTEGGRITVENFKKTITKNSKVLAITYVSNVMGYVSPLKEIIQVAHEHNMIVIVDAAQAVPHFPIDVRDLDCDFLAFSGHKMFAPTGVGVLYGKAEILKTLEPVEYGGDMNEDVGKDYVDIKDIPYRFEAGTPMIAEVLGLSEAIDFINKIGYENIHLHAEALHEYAINKLKSVEGVTVYNKDADVGIITFNIDDVHPHDAATIFDERGICVRAGHHCAQLVSKWLQCYGTLRASIHIYNDHNDIDRFVDAIKETVSFFKQFNVGDKL